MTRGRCKVCDKLVQLVARRTLVGPVLDYRPMRHDRPPRHVECGGAVHAVERNRTEDDVVVEERTDLECDKCGGKIESYAEECVELGACDGHDTTL